MVVVLTAIFVGIFFLWWRWSNAFTRVNSNSYPANSADSLSPNESLGVWILAVFIGLVSTLIVRPDPDDCFYLHQSAIFAERFFQPLTFHYTMFPDSMNIPVPHLTFLLNSFNHLIGFLSLITGLEPLEVAAYIITPSMAFLFVAVFAQIFKILLKDRWPWSLGVLLFLCFVEGSSYEFFTNYAFVRIWQGKSIFLHVIIPTLIIYIHEWHSFPQSRILKTFLIILAAIAGVGATNIALWLAIYMIGLTMLAFSSADRKNILTNILFFLLMIAYPLTVALIIFPQVVNVISHYSDNPFVGDSLSYMEIFKKYFVHIRIFVVYLALTLSAILFSERSLTRRFSFLSVTIFILTLGNPWLGGLVSKYVTSALVYDRILWCLPILILAPVGLVSGVDFLVLRTFPNFSLRQSHIARGFLIAIFLIGYGFYIPKVYALSSQNKVTLKRSPALKVDAIPFAIASFLVNRLPEGAAVVAPEYVSHLLPTFRKQLFPVVPRMMTIYDTFLRQLNDPQEYERRKSLFDYSTGYRFNLDHQRFVQWLDEYNVRAFVCPDKDIMFILNYQLLKNKGIAISGNDLARHLIEDELRNGVLLRNAGFKKIQKDQFQIWLR